MAKDWKNLKEMISYSEGGIISKELVKGKTNVTLFCMAKGTELTEHTSTREGVVYVIEGGGTFTLEGEKIPMLPGTFIHMKKKAVHSLKVNENTSFLLVLNE